MKFGALALASFLVSLVLATGCQQGDDPAVAQERAKYVLATEPGDAKGVLEVRGQVATGTTAPVVLVGRVAADASTTWDPGKAAFVVMDPSLESSADAGQGEAHGGEGHNADNCPFCKAKAKAKTDASALVQLVDSKGEVLPIDARKLLLIRENQVVVVRGVASIDDLGNLVVAADGVFPRP